LTFMAGMIAFGETRSVVAMVKPVVAAFLGTGAG